MVSDAGSDRLGVLVEEVGQARERRWWVRRRRVRSIERAAAFVDGVGFALLFPNERVLAPSLWEAVGDPDLEPFATGMNADEQRVWTWKDELPSRGLAWYGNFVAGRGSFLSPTMLRHLYPTPGAVDDHEQLELSDTAHELADALAHGPVPSSTLRVLIGDRHRYQRAAAELQRQLLVTVAGVHQETSGWPSALLDLTCRRFDVGAGHDLIAATADVLDVVLSMTASDLARVFRWPLADARSRLESLAVSGRAIRADRSYVVPSLARRLR
jgi:hypothetical protein